MEQGNKKDKFMLLCIEIDKKYCQNDDYLKRRFEKVLEGKEQFEHEESKAKLLHQVIQLKSEIGEMGEVRSHIMKNYGEDELLVLGEMLNSFMVLLD